MQGYDSILIGNKKTIIIVSESDKRKTVNENGRPIIDYIDLIKLLPVSGEVVDEERTELFHELVT